MVVVASAPPPLADGPRVPADGRAVPHGRVGAPPAVVSRAIVERRAGVVLLAGRMVRRPS